MCRPYFEGGYNAERRRGMKAVDVRTLTWRGRLQRVDWIEQHMPACADPLLEGRLQFLADHISNRRYDVQTLTRGGYNVYQQVH